MILHQTLFRHLTEKGGHFLLSQLCRALRPLIEGSRMIPVVAHPVFHHLFKFLDGAWGFMGWMGGILSVMVVMVGVGMGMVIEFLVHWHLLLECGHELAIACRRVFNPKGVD
jgi:hypothetical protein